MRVEKKRTFEREGKFVTEVGWFDTDTGTMPTAFERPATIEEAQEAGLAPAPAIEVEAPPQDEPDSKPRKKK